jgi:membrane-bound metal-dependent hydrolase YbcI (DUF457 family)
MLGFSHATSGALGWLAVAPTVAQALGNPLSAQELAVGTVACAGAALIPDLDHPSATIAYTFGPISKSVSKLTALLAGGHRQGTHSLLFSVGFGLVCYLVGMSSEWFHTPVPSIVMMFLLASFAFRGLNIVPPRTSRTLKGTVVLIEAAALTWFMATYLMPGMNWWWLGLAGAMGSIIHLIGDSLTPEGVPWLYPNRWRLAIPIISHTGNVLERAILGPIMVLVTGWLAIQHFGPLFGLTV